MKQVRLLPIVVLAASALLVLKTVGIVSGGGYTLGGITSAVAQDEQEADPAADNAAGDEQMMAAEAAAEALFRSTTSTSDPQDILMQEADGTGLEQVGDGSEQTRSTILERLSERRAELDVLEAELETRLAVVEAAELRLEERMTELSEVEARINALVDAREAEEAAQFASVVAMYENMRPADAATIFNDLDVAVLTGVGKAMSPRKLGPILAKMAPSKAQELTVLLARGEDENPAAANSSGQFAELPQIVGQ